MRWVDGSRRIALVIAMAGLQIASALPARAASPNQFGGQDRANAASEMIVLGVQQGISALPPTSGQAFTYEYNPAVDTYETSEQLGPTALRAAQTIGQNKLSVRAAVSYFSLGKTLDPIIYKVAEPLSYAEFGMSASANVTVLNFSATYGITDRIEAMLDVPVTVVEAQASQLQTVYQSDLGTTPRRATPLGAIQGFPTDTPKDVRNALTMAMHDPSDPLRVPKYSFSSLGFQFNDGTHVGLSRISVGAKALLYRNDLFLVSFAPEFFCNSPSQNEFAGSNSPSVLPRVIGQVNAAKYLRVHADVGYDYDFNVSELRRFVWDSGISVPLTGWTFDLGFGDRSTTRRSPGRRRRRWPRRAPRR